MRPGPTRPSARESESEPIPAPPPGSRPVRGTRGSAARTPRSTARRIGARLITLCPTDRPDTVGRPSLLKYRTRQAIGVAGCRGSRSRVWRLGRMRVRRLGLPGGKRTLVTGYNHSGRFAGPYNSPAPRVAEPALQTSHLRTGPGRSPPAGIVKETLR